MFFHWFLQEQREEVSSLSALLSVEAATAPPAACGAL